MPYGIKVLLDGDDITDKVSRLEITASLEAYCRELSLEIADPDLFDTFDFSTLPSNPTLEVQTRIDTDWVSQGLFFAEKPTYQVGINATETGIWGRSTTALLGPPFAVKITQSWETATTFFAICTDLCTSCGLTWDSSYCEVDDFVIHGNTYQAELKYPVEIIKEILQLAQGDNAHLTTDAAGNVCVKLVDRSPSAPDWTITDPIAVSLSEEPEWPDFGNRIRISAAGSLSGYSIQLVAPSSCLSADTETRGKLLARVTDSDGLPVQNVPVNWSARHDYVTFDAMTTNTKSVYFSELIRSKNFNEIDVQFPPETVIGIYSYRDFLRTDNISEDGYTLDGVTIRLTRQLSYCDQLLIVQYLSDGVAVNYATAGSQAGTEKITAEVAGNIATADLYLNNPCSCPATLSLRADPSSLEVGASSGLLAYVEIGGAPVRDGRSIWMTLDSTPVHGHLDWTQAYLGRVTIRNEESQVQNVVSGVSQCEISMHPYSVTGVWRAIPDPDGNIVKTGSSIYASHIQKVVNLDRVLTSGTRLIVDYVAVGAASNVYDGLTPGTDVVRAMIQTTREEPTEARVSISVSQASGGGDPPLGCCQQGLCQPDATSCEPEPQECEAGKVFCPRSGVWDCHAASECDSCEPGKITCNKDGAAGCWPSNECDTTFVDGGAGKKYGRKDGVEGCWLPEELDSCGAGRVRCYKSGNLGCYEVDECDTSYGGGPPVQCPPGTECCDHEESGLKGCWPSSECSGGGGGGSGGKGSHDPSGHEQCRKADGSMISCTNKTVCCEKGGVKGCWPKAECDSGGYPCSTTPCQDDPSDECLSSRFSRADEDCTCDDLCQQEFERFGTIQSYDGGSYRTFEEIVEQDYGLTPDTQEYWEKYGEIRIEAFDGCRKDCGDCANASTLELTGSDAVTAPGAYQYEASGGLQPYTWEVSGTGASIDEDGLVTLAAGACGAYTVTCTDTCGASASIDARITNNGTWGPVETFYESQSGNGCLGGSVYIYWKDDVIDGKYKYFDGYQGYRCCQCGTCNEGPPTGTAVEDNGWSNNNACATSCGCGAGPHAHWYGARFERRRQEWICP